MITKLLKEERISSKGNKIRHTQKIVMYYYLLRGLAPQVPQPRPATFPGRP